MSTRVRHEGGSCGFGFSPLYDPALMSQSNRVSIVVFFLFFSFLFPCLWPPRAVVLYFLLY